MGQTLIESADIAGVTFTGSLPVGMKIHRQFAQADGYAPPFLKWEARMQQLSPGMPM